MTNAEKLEQGLQNGLRELVDLLMIPELRRSLSVDLHIQYMRLSEGVQRCLISPRVNRASCELLNQLDMALVVLHSINDESDDCKDCEGTGGIEVGTCNTSRCKCDGFSGGCTEFEACGCPAGQAYEEANEPDWDAMAEDRREMREERGSW